MIHHTYFSRAQISYSLNRSITNTLQTFSPLRFFALCFVSFWYPSIRFRETPLVDDSRLARRPDSFLSSILTCEFSSRPITSPALLWSFWFELAPRAESRYRARVPFHPCFPRFHATRVINPRPINQPPFLAGTFWQGNWELFGKRRRGRVEKSWGTRFPASVLSHSIHVPDQSRSFLFITNRGISSRNFLPSTIMDTDFSTSTCFPLILSRSCRASCRP